MARTVKDVRLDNRAARLRLEPQKKPYYRLIETGRHVGYYKGLRTGSWIARTYDGGRYLEKTLGTADDTLDANGLDVLSFSDAQAAARRWFDELARIGQGGHVGPYTVGQACDHYLEQYLAGGGKYGGKDIANTRSRLDRIKAELGDVDVANLSKGKIEAWHRALRDSGPLSRTMTLDEATGRRAERVVDLDDREVKRRRGASANRMLTVLKAALNYAPPEGVTMPHTAVWRDVKPHKKTDAPIVRYLNDQEQVRLLNACPADFRDLVAAALLTGCRYGELCNLRVSHFNQAANSLHIEYSKSGYPRSVALTDEGTAHFARLAKGRVGNDLLLVRGDGTPWMPSHQLRRMAEACAVAKITPAISFHILRHTYGSRLAMRAVPMPVIAEQLGHKGTRMTERHYAHLGPSYVSATVRELMGTVGVPVDDTNVVALGAAHRPS